MFKKTIKSWKKGKSVQPIPTKTNTCQATENLSKNKRPPPTTKKKTRNKKPAHGE
jgi:hypothetical protein